jgi:hypothetical protein
MAPTADKPHPSTAATLPPRRRPRKRPRREEQEPIPAFGGRLLTAAVAAFAMLLVFVLDKSVRTPAPAPTDVASWRVGAKSKVRLTVITMDYERLTCTSDKVFGEEHCEYKSETEPFPRQPGEPIDDSKRHIIQPYRTYPDNQLILVSGVWSHPTIATRVQAEPWAGIPEHKQARFVAECDIEILGQLDEVKLRWKPNQSWGAEKKAWVAKSTGCRIGDTD